VTKRPLWALPLAAALAAGIVAVLLQLLFRAQRQTDEVWLAWARGRLAATATPHGDGASVIGVGSSVLHNALRSLPEKDAHDRPLRYVTLFRFGHLWDPVEILTDCVDARPAMILVESDVLFYQDHSTVRRLLNSTHTGLDNLAHGEPFLTTASEEAQNVEKLEHQFLPDTENPQPGMALAHRVQLFMPIDPRIPALFSKARDGGTTVVVLDFTNIEADAMILYPKEHVRSMRASLEELSRTTGALLWRFPGTFEMEDFADRGHMSRRGSKRYKAFIYEQIDAARGPLDTAAVP
jgi:hypothetical protein